MFDIIMTVYIMHDKGSPAWGVSFFSISRFILLAPSFHSLQTQAQNSKICLSMNASPIHLHCAQLVKREFCSGNQSSCRSHSLQNWGPACAVRNTFFDQHRSCKSLVTSIGHETCICHETCTRRPNTGSQQQNSWSPYSKLRKLTFTVVLSARFSCHWMRHQQ